jgi:hypothetical protein
VLSRSTLNAETSCPDQAVPDPSSFSSFRFDLRTPIGWRQLFCDGEGPAAIPPVSPDNPVGADRTMLYRLTCRTAWDFAPSFTMTLEVVQDGPAGSDDVYSYYHVQGLFQTAPIQT